MAIARVLVSGHYVLTPHVSVTLEQAATQTVTIMGQVRAPGIMRSIRPGLFSMFSHWPAD